MRIALSRPATIAPIADAALPLANCARR